jgi:hypothetical protein
MAFQSRLGWMIYSRWQPRNRNFDCPSEPQNGAPKPATGSPKRARYSVLGLALLQIGCLTHWQEQRGPVAEVLASKQPELVRLTLQDSTRLVLRHPTLVATGHGKKRTPTNSTMSRWL